MKTISEFTKRALILLVGLLAYNSVFSREFDYTDNKTTLIYTVIDEDAKTCMIKGWRKWSTGAYDNPQFVDLAIPSSVSDGTDTFTVISIGDDAFFNCNALYMVKIPNTVISIGSGAFSGCSGLLMITIPNSVTSIGDNAFSSCRKLESVAIPNSVTSIGDYAFSGCTGQIGRAHV